MKQADLFAYGTLLVPQIISSVIGRCPHAQPATLDGHARFLMRGEVFPGVVPRVGHAVAGCVYAGLTNSELCLLDEYEGAAYERLQLVTRVASQAQPAAVYVVRTEFLSRLSDDPWDLDLFIARDLSAFRRTWS